MRKSGVITESEEASKEKCASIAPAFMLSIRLWRFCEGVTDTVVPGQTCNSPPLDKRRIVVSEPAVTDEPEPPSFPERAKGPSARTAVTTGWGVGVRLVVVAGWKGEASVRFGFLPRCTTRRFAAESPVKESGASQY